MIYGIEYLRNRFFKCVGSQSNNLIEKMKTKTRARGLAPRPLNIEPADESQIMHKEHAGIVTWAEEVALSKERADISMRKILTILLAVFILLCMGAYFVDLLTTQNSQGLSSFITILVGLLGIITGYYFGSRKDELR